MNENNQENKNAQENRVDEGKRGSGGYTPMTDAQLKKARRITTVVLAVIAMVVLVIFYLKKGGVI